MEAGCEGNLDPLTQMIACTPERPTGDPATTRTLEGRTQWRPGSEKASFRRLFGRTRIRHARWSPRSLELKLHNRSRLFRSFSFVQTDISHAGRHQPHTQELGIYI